VNQSAVPQIENDDAIDELMERMNVIVAGNREFAIDAEAPILALNHHFPLAEVDNNGHEGHERVDLSEFIFTTGCLFYLASFVIVGFTIGLDGERTDVIWLRLYLFYVVGGSILFRIACVTLRQ
jgi:hypothetical protein